MLDYLQIEQFVLQTLMSACLECVPNQISEFMGIHHWSWHFDWSGPIVVIEGLVICQFPEEILGNIQSVVDDIVMGWSAGSLGDILRSHEEVEMIRDHIIGYNCSRSWILVRVSCFWEKSVIDSFGHNYVSKLWLWLICLSVH